MISLEKKSTKDFLLNDLNCYTKPKGRTYMMLVLNDGVKVLRLTAGLGSSSQGSLGPYPDD